MPEPLRILLTGKPDLKDRLAEELAKGAYSAEIVAAPDLEQYCSSLAQPWDLAIVRLAGRERDGAAAVRAARERQPEMPVLVISGRIPEEEIAGLLEVGAEHITDAQLRRLNTVVARLMHSAQMRRERANLEAQFYQAQKMEAVGRLAGGIAHDFNNVLTVITGYTDLLLGARELPDPRRKLVEEIRRAAERGTDLTQRLLSFSRRQPMQARPLRLNDLIVRMKGLIEPLIGEDIKLVMLPAAEQDTVSADPTRIEQVVMNLVVNARDAMPQGGVLTIETADAGSTPPAAGMAAGCYVSLAVSDTGVGMDRETLGHMFEPFFTTKGKRRGTGLGLATAYGTVTQSGGHIRIDSTPGEGTTATVYLPVTNEVAIPESPPEPAAVRLDGTETVLVVEDEPRVRRVVCDVLTARGYQVIEASNGEEAVGMAGLWTEPIHLLVVDVVMPEMGGPEAAKAILADRPESRVLYISGYSEETLFQRGIPKTGAGFLAKPFLPAALLRKAREVLDARE